MDKKEKKPEWVYFDEVVQRRKRIEDGDDVIMLSVAARLMNRALPTIVGKVERGDLPAVRRHPKDKVHTLRSACLEYMKTHPEEYEEEEKGSGKLSDISGYRSIPNAQRARAPVPVAA